MFIVSKVLLISSATVIVRAGGAIWLNPFATVLFSVCSTVTVECCVLYPCCMGVFGMFAVMYLPHNAHCWLLSPLLNQPHISHKFYIKYIIKFLHRMLHYNNSVVNQCIMHASHNANTLIGYKLSLLDLNLVTIYMI